MSSGDEGRKPSKRLINLTNTDEQRMALEKLMKNPDKPVKIPERRTGFKPPKEIIRNVQGSVAGAGSGEFHVYRASRRREYARLGAIEREIKNEEKNAKFQARRDSFEAAAAEKTSKNRNKRNRRKMNQMKRKDEEKMEALIKENSGASKNGVSSEKDISVGPVVKKFKPTETKITDDDT